MTTFDTGRRAQAAAAAYLQQRGFKVIGQNWRTRTCEIDVVAVKDKTMYFVEVKYRQTAAHGAGLQYVTPRKIAQMQFAGESWVLEHKWPYDYRLAAAEVSGVRFAVTAFIDNVY